jgi:hypothetical protein
VISWPHRHFWRCGTNRSTIISGHIGHSRNTNKSHPTRRSQRLLARLLRAAASLNHQHERPAGGEWRRICPPACPLRALAPRLACALNRPLFVHFVQSAQALPALVRHAKNNIKNVQICAQLCSRIRLIYLTYGYLRVILYLTSKRAFLLQPRLNILALLLCTIANHAHNKIPSFTYIVRCS